MRNVYLPFAGIVPIDLAPGATEVPVLDETDWRALVVEVRWDSLHVVFLHVRVYCGPAALLPERPPDMPPPNLIAY